MKCLHIITGLGDGGAEASLYNLCTASQSYCDHFVISLTGKDKYGPLLGAAGIPVVSLNMPRGRVTLSGLVRLLALVRKYRPNLTQTWMYHADLLGGIQARLAGHSKVFWNVRHADLVPGATAPNTLRVARVCATLSCLVPHGIVACAERAREVHVAMGYDARKFTVIPNGYKVEKFRPSAATGAAVRHELGIGSDTPLIGLVGRWNAQKDHANLLTAFAMLLRGRPEARLLLVGTGCGPENAELKTLIQERGLFGRVTLAGRRDDIPAVMNALDLHVLSSYTEAFPNVVAEAMACGTPCVVTNVGDAALIVGDTGWVVPPRNPEALAGAIAEALSERENADRWADRQRAARRRIVDEFSLETMVARYRELWGSAQ